MKMIVMNRFHIIKRRAAIVAVNEIHLVANAGQYELILFNPRSKSFPDNNWAIYSGNGSKNYYYINGMEKAKENFVGLLTTDYPDDMTWILFHPEVLDGEWNG